MLLEYVLTILLTTSIIAGWFSVMIISLDNAQASLIYLLGEVESRRYLPCAESATLPESSTRHLGSFDFTTRLNPFNWEWLVRLFATSSNVQDVVSRTFHHVSEALEAWNVEGICAWILLTVLCHHLFCTYAVWSSQAQRISSAYLSPKSALSFIVFSLAHFVVCFLGCYFLQSVVAFVQAWAIYIAAMLIGLVNLMQVVEITTEGVDHKMKKMQGPSRAPIALKSLKPLGYRLALGWSVPVLKKHLAVTDVRGFTTLVSVHFVIGFFSGLCGDNRKNIIFERLRGMCLPRVDLPSFVATSLSRAFGGGSRGSEITFTGTMREITISVVQSMVCVFLMGDNIVFLLGKECGTKTKRWVTAIAR